MEQRFDYVSFNKAGREERNKQLAGGLKMEIEMLSGIC
jgi:hypothetical protein